MQQKKNITLEFPASKDYVSIVQEFFINSLKAANFTLEFAKKIIFEPIYWLSIIAVEEKDLYRAPTVKFNLELDKQRCSIRISTTDGKEFNASYQIGDSVKEDK